MDPAKFFFNPTYSCSDDVRGEVLRLITQTSAPQELPSIFFKEKRNDPNPEAPGRCAAPRDLAVLIVLMTDPSEPFACYPDSKAVFLLLGMRAQGPQSDTYLTRRDFEKL
jgi:hypothetical protein